MILFFEILLVVVSVIIAWFAIMIELVRRLHANFTDKTLLKIKRAMAILVWALAIAFAYRATAPWVQQF